MPGDELGCSLAVPSLDSCYKVLVPDIELFFDSERRCGLL